MKSHIVRIMKLELISFITLTKLRQNILEQERISHVQTTKLQGFKVTQRFYCYRRFISSKFVYKNIRAPNDSLHNIFNNISNNIQMVILAINASLNAFNTSSKFCYKNKFATG